MPGGWTKEWTPKNASRIVQTVYIRYNETKFMTLYEDNGLKLAHLLQSLTIRVGLMREVTHST